jgi:Phosphopantetheine attachment site
VVLQAGSASVSDFPANYGHKQSCRLAQIWQRLLGLPQIDIQANFFELGGHSLLAARLFAMCEKTFGRTLPLSTLVHAPTVANWPACCAKTRLHPRPAW